MSLKPIGTGIRTTLLKRDYQKMKRAKKESQADDKLKLDR